MQKQWKLNPITENWEIFHKSYVYDGEWFAVEWFYRAAYLDDGFTQWECTLGIGRIVDGKMILWTEYFDDAVGKLQRLHLMPNPEPDEEVFPWPAKAKVSLPYRP